MGSYTTLKLGPDFLRSSRFCRQSVEHNFSWSYDIVVVLGKSLNLRLQKLDYNIIIHKDYISLHKDYISVHKDYITLHHDDIRLYKDDIRLRKNDIP